MLFDYTPARIRPALNWWWWESNGQHTVSTVWADEDIQPGTEPAEQQDWMRQHGVGLLEDGGEWNLPRRTRDWFQRMINMGDWTTLRQLTNGEISLN